MRSRISSSRSLLIVWTLIALANACGDERLLNIPDARLSKGSGSGGGSTPTTPAAPAVPTVQSLTIAPTMVTAGATATGTIALTAAAPAGGTAVAVMSNNTTAATVDPTV